MYRMEAEAPQARDMFAKDLDVTYTRIARRVKELADDKLAEEEREIQEGLARVAAATQLDGSLALPVGPDGEGTERAAVFASFPRSFQGTFSLIDSTWKLLILTNACIPQRPSSCKM
jgi:hypothetical protein